MVHLNVTAFVEAWTALYTHFNAVGYIPPDYVVYPPFSPSLPAPQNSLNVHPLVLLTTQLPDGWSLVLDVATGTKTKKGNPTRVRESAMSIYEKLTAY
jgi:hypothetical protein